MIRYGKIENGILKYAENSRVIDGKYYASLPRSMHLKLGEKVVENRPAPKNPPREGYHWERDGWHETAIAFVPKWKAVKDAAPPPRTFSKLKLYAALANAGLWDDLKQWLEHQTVEGVNAWTAYDQANELTDGHPMFKQWFAAAKAALGVSDEAAEAILAASVAEA